MPSASLHPCRSQIMPVGGSGSVHIFSRLKNAGGVPFPLSSDVRVEELLKEVVVVDGGSRVIPRATRVTFACRSSRIAVPIVV